MRESSAIHADLFEKRIKANPEPSGHSIPFYSSYRNTGIPLASTPLPPLVCDGGRGRRKASAFRNTYTDGIPSAGSEQTQVFEHYFMFAFMRSQLSRYSVGANS